MSNKANHGGPAFPIPLNAGELYNGMAECDGMTLRDYFAAKAMQALISSRHIDFENGQYEEDQVSVTAYAMADAMLKARGE